MRESQRLKRPEIRLRFDPEHAVENAEQPKSIMQQEEHHPNISQFEREFGAHNLDRKSGWTASNDHAHSLEEDQS